MRVIAGEFRSRRLQSLPGLDVRPTPDRLRETLFNILTPRIKGSVFVDAYAGTGAVGIEAISRGAKQAVFIERNRQAVETIQANLKSLGIRGEARVIKGAATLHLASIKADIVFLDPPYPLESEYRAAMEVMAANPPAIVVAQHSVRYSLPEKFEAFERTRFVKQGDNALSFYAPVSGPDHRGQMRTEASSLESSRVSSPESSPASSQDPFPAARPSSD
ncbi:MAG TPA: 16S rRNA (guanine(966)-N(2))-methyltransferase RsmD [Bryobacteraceae bacterium]|nr:16S rRNA (guanine(966)-N(2))-methyltransferase RsmD [Bryobacteraceae bacterium]